MIYDSWVFFTTFLQEITVSRTSSLAAVGDDTGPSAVMTTQLPRLSWRVTTNDDLVIFSFDPSILRWDEIGTTCRWNNKQLVRQQEQQHVATKPKTIYMSFLECYVYLLNFD